MPNYHRTQQKDVNNRLNSSQPRRSVLDVRENKFCTIIKLWVLSTDTVFLISMIRFSPVNRNRWVHDILAWRVIWGQHNHINTQTNTRHGKSSAEPAEPNETVHKKWGCHSTFTAASCCQTLCDCSQKTNGKAIIFALWHIVCSLRVSVLIIWLPHVFLCCSVSVDNRRQWKSYCSSFKFSFSLTT